MTVRAASKGAAATAAGVAPAPATETAGGREAKAEREHWNTGGLKGIVEPLWPAVNADLDAITISKADAADEAAARPLLQAKIDACMKTFDRELTRTWNAVPDTPGQAGANGYIAGQKILDELIAAVQAHGKAKGW